MKSKCPPKTKCSIECSVWLAGDCETLVPGVEEVKVPWIERLQNSNKQPDRIYVCTECGLDNQCTLILSVSTDSLEDPPDSCVYHSGTPYWRAEG